MRDKAVLVSCRVLDVASRPLLLSAPFYAAAFVKVVEEEGKLDPASAEKYVRQLEKSGRYVVEAWA